ncbi:MAG: DUF1295 domain-containing protein [Bacteroidales bacterium]|nr:DUF1295 domain-containing protein [Bacteroidales bacterium]
MLRTILFLIITLMIVPLIAIYSDISFTDLQWELLKSSAIIMLVISLLCFLVSELSKNYSQVDKLWSITPVIYVWYFVFHGGLSIRMLLMGILVIFWGVRLSYNFNRRGGYNILPWRGEEDYRWEVLREIPLLKGRFRWGIFNLFFISLYQNTLLLLISLPALFVIHQKESSLNWIDLLAAVLMIGFIIIETIADQQQYNFQKEKYKRIDSKEKLTGNYANGFLTAGLWKYSRHPNYTAEQAIWISFYLFSVAATGQWLNWSLAGSVLLVLLFFGSSSFSEKISAAKYPEYQKYQKRTGRFLPRLF